MSFTLFLQIFANVFFAVCIFVIFARLRRPAKDDPRLSKGLQLLSSKIAVLEDLSDRTETQVQQMLLLLDQKSKELQSKIALAEQQVLAVRQSMDQSLEVAQIFQDKIPHNEIIERQNSVKYIKAARMAHAGVSVADIAREVDLPMGEIEFIAKVNQDSLSFREEDLPAWARDPRTASEIAPQAYEAQAFEAPSFDATAHVEAPRAPAHQPQDGLVQKLSKLQFEMQNLDLELAHRAQRNVVPDMTQAFEAPRVESTTLERLGEEFRRAVEQAEREANGDWSQAPSESVYSEAPSPTAAVGSNQSEIFTSPIPSAESAAIAPVAQTPAQATSQAQLQAAPRTAQAPPPSASTLAREVSIPELEAARAAAAALRATEHVKPSVQNIRRVEFPRI